MTESKRCTCGWERPLIIFAPLDKSSATLLEFAAVVPVYRCPRCGALYFPEEISAASAAALVKRFEVELAKAAAPKVPS